MDAPGCICHSSAPEKLERYLIYIHFSGAEEVFIYTSPAPDMPEKPETYLCTPNNTCSTLATVTNARNGASSIDLSFDKIVSHLMLAIFRKPSNEDKGGDAGIIATTIVLLMKIRDMPIDLYLIAKVQLLLMKMMRTMGYITMIKSTTTMVITDSDDKVHL